MTDHDLSAELDDEFEDPTAWMLDEIIPDGYEPADDPSTRPPDPPVDGERGTVPTRGQFPVAPAAVPPWVKEFENGRLPLERLTQVAPLGPGGLLVPEAVEPWRAFQEAARRAGFTLTMTNAYRTYDQQVNLFRQRYDTTDNGGKTKIWNGVTYWQKPKTAMAATPGTSNHGWAMGIDMALNRYDMRATQVESVPAFMIWAVANARQYGWSWEVQSEPWHVRLVEYDKAATSAPAARPAQQRLTAPTGVPAPELVRSPTNPPPVNEEVRALQSILIAQGWATFTKADGRFGEATELAVKAMQAELGFTTPDGKYGPKTAARLAEHLASR